MKYWWFSFECNGNSDCCDVISDVRLHCSEDAAPPNVLCPTCNAPMRFRARWEADAWGYASRGDVASTGGPKILVHLMVDEPFDSEVLVQIPGTNHARTYQDVDQNRAIRQAIGVTVPGIFAGAIVEASAAVGTKVDFGESINIEFLVLRRER